MRQSVVFSYCTEWVNLISRDVNNFCKYYYFMWKRHVRVQSWKIYRSSRAMIYSEMMNIQIYTDGMLTCTNCNVGDQRRQIVRYYIISNLNNLPCKYPSIYLSRLENQKTTILLNLKLYCLVYSVSCYMQSSSIYLCIYLSRHVH